MSRDPLEDEDDQYVSAEDSDFAPEDAVAGDSGDSDSESEAGTTTHKKRKQTTTNEVIADDGNNSGDEAIVNRGKKKLKKSKDASDDEGGEGGLIKTRSQRAVEKEEKKVQASLGPVTIDVDEVWKQMISGKPVNPKRPTTPEPTSEADAKKNATATTPNTGSPGMIRIKRTYNFAGKVHTEEKMVARDSAEAKLFLASQGEQPEGEASPPKRLTKKAFRSAFEPLGDINSRRSDLNLGLAARMAAAKEAAATKLNTVEKSRMDWAGYVDKEGIKDELELAGKSKTSYMARQDFLGRSQLIREEDARKARFANRA